MLDTSNHKSNFVGQPFCAGLCGRNAHGHVRIAISCENFEVKCRRARPRKTRTAEFARACAIEMHTDIAQQPALPEIAGSQVEHPD